MMSDMTILDRKYDICLSMTWYPDQPHRISGHVFEIIDYFVILSTKLNVCILFGDTFKCWDEFKPVITRKYSLSDDQLNSIKNSTYFTNLPRFIKGNKILFVDGDLHRLKRQGTKLIFDRVYSFKCSRFDTLYDVPYDVTILQDDRVYDLCNPEDTKLSINYKKKINFDILKQVDTCTESTGLIYATINCRQISDTDLLQVADSYEFEKYVVITEQCRSIPDDRFEFTVPPLQDMFSRFNTYIYTPTRGMFDGSPRLPAECKHYDRDVIYHNIDNDYLEHDTGLKNRMMDIESNFDSIRLTESDDIINILEAT